MIRVLAPAKVNLGLEVLGKRTDGYHEIRTILCAVSVFDSLDLDVEADEPGAFHVDDARLRDGNLVEATLQLIARRCPGLRLPAVELRKRIPTASGLGGASSDAAAILAALSYANPQVLDCRTVYEMASRLGSDVPFFLRAGMAVASGRGESLRPLPFQRVDMVIVHPAISILDKTRTMYGRLGPDSWTDGSSVEASFASLQRCEPIDAHMPLLNAFTVPLYAMQPHLVELAARIGQASELPVQLSGAGPAHFVLCRDVEHRQWLRNRLRALLPTGDVRVLGARSVPSILLQES